MSSHERRFRFGIQLQAQRTSWAAFSAALQVVDQLGFDSVWNFDHLLPYAGPVDGDCFETLTTLGAMAALTKNVRIGSLVNGVLYRDPATLAKSAVTVDHISNGRLEFALGAAWAEREFRAYGLPFPPARERLERLDEALEIVKALWTQERVSYQGTYYTLQDAPCAPKPVQRPHPPIMVGGLGKTTLRIAARHANIWNGVGSPDQCAAAIAQLRSFCDEAGRDLSDIELSAHPQFSIARSHAEAEARARAAAAALGHDFESERAGWVVGTPDEVYESLQRYVDVGITYWVLAIASPFDLDGLELFMNEVKPRFS